MKTKLRNTDACSPTCRRAEPFLNFPEHIEEKAAPPAGCGNQSSSFRTTCSAPTDWSTRDCVGCKAGTREVPAHRERAH